MAAQQVGLSRDELRTVAAQLLAQRAQEIAVEEGISPEAASHKTAFAITEALLEYVVLLIEANNQRLSDERRATSDEPG